METWSAPRFSTTSETQPLPVRPEEVQTLRGEIHLLRQRPWEAAPHLVFTVWSCWMVHGFLKARAVQPGRDQA